MEWGLDSYVNYAGHKETLKEVRVCSMQLIATHTPPHTQEGRVSVATFFSLLDRDLEKINLFVKQLETYFRDHMKTLRSSSKSSLKKGRIFDAHNEGKALHCYQQLNKTSFEKIVKKFQKVMGLRQMKKKNPEDEEDDVVPCVKLPESQKARLREQCDEYLASVEEAYFMNPERIDLAGELQDLTVCNTNAPGGSASMLQSEAWR